MKNSSENAKSELDKLNTELLRKNAELTAKIDELWITQQELLKKNQLISVQNEELRAMQYELQLLTKELEKRVENKSHEVSDKELQLDKVKTKLQHIISSSPIIIYTCGLSANYAPTFLSDNIVLYTGYTFKEYIDNPDLLMENIHSDDRKNVLEKLSKIIKTDVLEVEFRFKNRDGTYRWWRNVMSLVRDISGEPVEISCVMSDITERKENEEKLIQSEKKYRELFANMNTCVAVYKPVDDECEDFIFVDFNKAAEFAEKINSEEVIGRKLTGVFPGTKEFGILDVLKKVFRTGKSEYFVPREYIDGRIRGWRDNYIYKLPDGNVVAMYEDVTDKVALEDELEFRAMLLDSSVDPMLLTDFSRKIIYANESAYKRLGYAKEEMLQKNIDSIEASESEKNVKNRYKILKNGGRVIFETEFIKKDKSRISVEVQAQTVTTPDKKKLIFSVVRDITERKNMEDMLTNSARLAAVGQLAAGIAHEFNNILAIIKGTAQNSLYEVERHDFGNIPVNMKIIDQQTVRGADIVRNMIAFSAPRPLNKNRISLVDCVREVIKIHSKTFELEKINIELSENFDIFVFADRTQIQQVILNMTINAIHAIKPIGYGNIKYSVYESNGNAILEIADTGTGIPAHLKSMIFMPFFTTKGGMSRDNLRLKGTGLGLSISLRIIENHGGSIIFDSSENGTVFTVVLPSDDEESENARDADNETEIISAYRKSNLKILLVDDEPILLSSLSKILKNTGFENVHISSTGKSALEIVRKNKINVIILDLLMPEMNGYEFLEIIRNENPGIAVIIVSGEVEIPEQPLLENGAFAVLRKPMDYNDLIRSIREAEAQFNFSV